MLSSFQLLSSKIAPLGLRGGVAAILLIAAIRVYAADGQTAIIGDFETGQVQRSSSTHDGFFIKTLPDPQGSAREISVGRGGAGPNSGLDTRVVPSESVGSETIKPRSGKYFLRSAIYYNKDYSKFSGSNGKNKPRSTIGLGAHSFAYDTEGYIGFSIYVPKNFENEMGKRGEQGKAALLNVAAPGAETFFGMSIFVPRSGSEAHWHLFYQVNAQSVRESDRATVSKELDMGSVSPDKGKWTDFVIRFRSNPFSTATNPAKKGIKDAKDQMYQGKKGILQVWKGEGSKMVLKVNLENTPVGLVPHKQWTLATSFRIYKFGWHEQPTSVRGPVWFGFDEIRFGLTERNGTTFADVNPSRQGCTNCAISVADKSAPQAPKSLVIGD